MGWIKRSRHYQCFARSSTKRSLWLRVKPLSFSIGISLGASQRYTAAMCLHHTWNSSLSDTMLMWIWWCRFTATSLLENGGGKYRLVEHLEWSFTILLTLNLEGRWEGNARCNNHPSPHLIRQDTGDIVHGEVSISSICHCQCMIFWTIFNLQFPKLASTIPTFTTPLNTKPPYPLCISTLLMSNHTRTNKERYHPWRRLWYNHTWYP